jgi:hypothetical protein
MNQQQSLQKEQLQLINVVNPLRDNPLQSRADLQQAVRDLFVPLKKWFSQGCALVRPGYTGSFCSQRASELEGFARPLWGLVPLLAGGGDFDNLQLYHEGLLNGSDPQHPEYWGRAEDHDQILVEMAAIGFAIAIAPQAFWEPLSQTAKQNLVNWLQQINQVLVPDNNWLFFRVLVNLGLENVGAQTNKKALNSSLQQIEHFYLGDGWYADGLKMQRDYYISFAFHYYGLIYARLAQSSDPVRCQHFCERAALFAQDFIHWFSANGAAIPFGRSLSYRFAQGSFWGALAFANVEDGLPWGIIKGLTLRHLRWWAQQDIFNNDGTLSIGYTYPNLNIADEYISPGSPYWALKIFLPLALPDSHPFWQANEESLPNLPAVRAQNHPGMVLCADKNRSHIFALSSQQYVTGFRNGEATYAKFAYSTAFGFSIPSCQIGLAAGAYDSALALSEDNRHFRVREGPLEAHLLSTEQVQSRLQQLQSRLPAKSYKWWQHNFRRLKSISASRRHAKTILQIEDATLFSLWQPWPDVTVETWLFPMLPWHVRVHRLHNGRLLYSAEGGFALDRTEDCNDQTHYIRHKTGKALATYPAGLSGLRDLKIPGKGRTARRGQVQIAYPNTNLLHPRTVIPSLVGEHEEGEHWLICAVLGLPGVGNFEEIWNNPPTLLPGSDFNHRIVIRHQNKEKVLLFEDFIIRAKPISTSL